MQVAPPPLLLAVPDDPTDTAGHLAAYAGAGCPCLGLTWVTRVVNRRTGVIRLRCSCGRLAGPEPGECPSAAKHPIGAAHPHGLLEASTDARVLSGLLRRYPYLNVGIRTGARPEGAGVVVVDVDPRHGGDETLRSLLRRHGPLPDTWETLTGSLGRHLWFRHPGGGLRISNDAGRRLGPGLDVRADNAYVVVAPSVHASGRRYCWELSSRPDEVPLAPLPGWVLEPLVAPTRGTRPGAPREPWAAQLLADGAPEGQRNESAFRLASLLRHYGLPQDVVEVILGDFAARCRPPLPADELRTVVGGVYGRYGPGREHVPDPEPPADLGVVL